MEYSLQSKCLVTLWDEQADPDGEAPYAHNTAITVHDLGAGGRMLRHLSHPSGIWHALWANPLTPCAADDSHQVIRMSHCAGGTPQLGLLC